MTTEKGDRLSNFECEVKSVTDYMDFYGERLYVGIEICIFNDKVTKEISIKYDELDGLDFEKVDISFLVNISVQNAHKLIIYNIKQQAAALEHKSVTLLDKLGWYRNGAEICYNAGDCVITNSNITYLTNPELAKDYHLRICEHYSEKQAIKGMFDIMNIDVRYSPILVGAGLLGVMRSIIIEAGIRPPCAIYVVGETQNRKTTLTTLCTRLYNRDEMGTDSTVNMARVCSSTPMLESLLASSRDCAFILDDLFRNPDSKMRKEAERNVRNILRNYADNSPRRNMRSQHEINGQLIITAEYIIDNITDIGRCFMVHIKDVIASERLTKAQSEPLMLSTFYYYFIKHCCMHYDKIIDFISNEYELFKKERVSHKGHYERIYETGFLLMCMCKIVCNYALEKGVISAEVGKGVLNKTESSINKMIEFHSEVISRKKVNSEEFNLAQELILLLDDKIPVGKCGSVCFIKKGYLYIRTKAIINALYDVYGVEYSSKKVSGYFSSKGISESYNSSKNMRNVKKYNNKSYLVLNWDALHEEAYKEKDPIQKIL